MTDDSELLRRFESEASEAAFNELVERHLNFVYASALRRVGGDRHLAQDVTQMVFTALARSASNLVSRRTLTGWLFTTAQYVSAQFVREQRRRRNREQEAQFIISDDVTNGPSTGFDWETLRPVIDETLDKLSEPNREAVFLRFFESKSFREIGDVLSLSENAARMKVERALDRLHALLSRRGISSTTGALALALSNQVTAAAPVGMASSISSVAVMKAASAIALPTFGIFMSTTKIAVTAVVAALAVGTATYEFRAKLEIERQRDQLLVERDTMRAQLVASSRQLQDETARARAADDDNERLLKLVNPPATGKSTTAVAAIRPPGTEPTRFGMTTKPPVGWGKNGSKPSAYAVGEDQNQMLNGVPSAYVSSLEPEVEGFGGMMQTSSPDNFAGKRIRFSGWMKTEDAVQGGHLWLRIDGQAADGIPQFDNMEGRAPTGTTGWQQYSVVLDVPAEAKAVAYGMFLQGSGKMWVNSTKLEVVGEDIPSTNMRKKKAGALN